MPSAADDSRRYPHHVTMQGIGHERQRQEQGEKDRNYFWNKGQRLLLHARDRLQYGDDDTDHEADDQCWHRNHHGSPSSPRLGAGWRQPDLGYWTIAALEKIGLAETRGLRNASMVE